MPLSFPSTATLKLWGSLASCVAVGNRHAGRFPIGPQVPNLPHNFCSRPLSSTKTK